MLRLTPWGRLGAALGRKILFYIYSLHGQPYDLKEEARLAGFHSESHFRAFLENCPKYANGKYGPGKYRALCQQAGLPQANG
jgi:hypothetical protein